MADVTAQPGETLQVDTLVENTGDTQDTQDIILNTDAPYIPPDQDKLHAHYDAREISATDGDTLSSWADKTSNGFDLTATGSPTYRASEINGYAAVNTDGASDLFRVTFSDQSTPNHVFGIFEWDSTPGDIDIAFSNTDTDGSKHWLGTDSSGGWALNGASGSRITGGSSDTGIHIWSGLFNPSGSTSVLRIDGTQVASGDISQVPLSGITLGADGTDSNFANVNFGEMLIYPEDKSSTVQDIEQYFADKWDVTL